MRRIKLKSKKKPLIVYIYIFIIIIIFSFISINILNKKIRTIIFDYAEIETKKFTNYIINESISKNITKTITTDEIFKVTEGNDGNIKSIDFDTARINKYLTNATKTIQKYMNDIEKGNIYRIDNIDELTKKYNKEDLKKGIIFYANTGLIFGNSLLSNLGPKIPVKISLTGDVISYISVETKEYGINNALIEVFANIEVTEDILLPFYDKNIDMKAKVPIAMKLITGKIPEFYYGNIKESQKISIPNS
ncbi:MAG: sporulation protein YunB [Bacilli bacterium]|nr:sporulation protein YunB [Bacilli bacterium]